MKSKVPAAISLTLIMLYTSVMGLSTHPDDIFNIESVGFPFNIYKSGDDGGLSVIGLLGNLFVFFSISWLGCIAFEKIKKIGANRNLRTYP